MDFSPHLGVRATDQDTPLINELFLDLTTQIEVNTSLTSLVIYDEVTQIRPSDAVFLELMVQNQGEMLKSIFIQVMTHNISWIRTYRTTEDLFTSYYDFFQPTMLVMFLDGLREYQSILKINLTVEYHFPFFQNPIVTRFFIISGKLLHTQIQNENPQGLILPTSFNFKLLGNEHFQLSPFKVVIQTLLYTPRFDNSKIIIDAVIDTTEVISHIDVNGQITYDYSETNNEITLYTTMNVTFVEISLEMDYQLEKLGERIAVEVRQVTVEREEQSTGDFSKLQIGPHPLPSEIVYLLIFAVMLTPLIYLFLTRKKVGQHIDESSLYE
jgi:hypothetical protein